MRFSQRVLSDHSMISISNLPTTSCVSSTLTKLNIMVNAFDDCLYLLDGRLESLSTLVIEIWAITDSLSNKDNTVNINGIIKEKYICL